MLVDRGARSGREKEERKKEREERKGERERRRDRSVAGEFVKHQAASQVDPTNQRGCHLLCRANSLFTLLFLPFSIHLARKVKGKTRRGY